jgi:DNA polymerase family A
MAAAARTEDCGVPIDTDALERLRRGWPTIQDRLIARVDQDYGVFDGRTFKVDRWATWLETRGIPWPRLASGRLALDDDTFRSMARRYPDIEPMRELRTSLAQLRLEDLAVGTDGRNRCLLSAFHARTSRNQPSSSRFIFGPAVWLRGLIRPEPGMGLAYVDWSQQEFGIAAALSNDPAMREAYESGDSYLAFAKQAGAAPADASSQSHGTARELFKACALAVQYGMGHEALAQQTGLLPAEARELLRLHRRTYREFWRWSDAVVDVAMATGALATAFGWPLQIVPPTNARSLRNFPMQANGAEMLRLACCLATERGIRVCAPVHDALLIEAPAPALEQVVEATQAAMAEASMTVLDGFPLRSAARLIRYPDRYQDERGARMWSLVWQTLDTDDAGRSSRCASAT